MLLQCGDRPCDERRLLDLPELEPFPDIGSLSDDELKSLIEKLQREEQAVSYRRRLLHGQIDILRKSSLRDFRSPVDAASWSRWTSTRSRRS